MKVIGGNRLPFHTLSFVAHAEVVSLDRVTRKELKWRAVLLQELQFLIGDVLFIAAARRRFRKLDNPAAGADTAADEILLHKLC